MGYGLTTSAPPSILDENKMFGTRTLPRAIGCRRTGPPRYYQCHRGARAGLSLWKFPHGLFSTVNSLPATRLALRPALSGRYTQPAGLALEDALQGLPTPRQS